MSVYTIRNMDEKTKGLLQEYAYEHGVNIAEAVRELVFLGFKHSIATTKKKKYASFFEVYDELNFKGGKNLSRKIDDEVYL